MDKEIIKEMRNAIKKNDLYTIKYLIDNNDGLLYENGADFDVSSFYRNPLFAAIYNGHLDVARFLVEKGIDFKVHYAIGDLENVDAYEYARQYGQTEITEYLKSKLEENV